MAALDSVSRSLAVELIEQFGASATLVKGGAKAYDPASGKQVAAEGSRHSVTVTPPEPWRAHRDDGAIERGSMETIMAADAAPESSSRRVRFSRQRLPEEPAIDDALELSGQRWRIAEVYAIWSGAEVAAYRLRLTR